MAQIRERIKKNGKKSYFVRIRMKGKPEATASFERITDARLWARTTETEIRERRFAESTEAQRHTLSDLINRYIRDVLPRKPKIQPEYALQLKWWADQIGDVFLSDLSSSMISEHRDMLCERITIRKSKNSNARVNRYMAALSTAISTAVKEWEWIEDNPLRKISKLKEPRDRVRYLSDEERQRFIKACQESYNKDLYTAVILALSTGGRQKEIWGLSWKCADLKHGFITFEGTSNIVARSVPLQGLALELMQKRFSLTRFDFLLEERRQRLVKGTFNSQNSGIDNQLVFPSTIDPKRHFDFRRPFEMALKESAIEDFRWNDLRHCAASYLVMAGKI
jgi:integrase